MKCLFLSLMVMGSCIFAAEVTPLQRHSHVKIIIDKDSPINPQLPEILSADNQKCCCSCCSQKMKIALLSGTATIVGAAVSAGVTLALRNCK